MQAVYMLRAGQSQYKIGVSSNVSKRVASLQTGNSNLVEVVTSKIVNDPYKVEQQIHKRLHAMKTNGGKEWFALEPEEAIEIAILINRFLGLEIIEKLTIAEILDRQKILDKSIGKKLDFVINAYQKDYKPEPLIKSENETVDDIYETAINICRLEGKASTSFLQRSLSIGYGRAARIIDKMEQEGIVSQLNGIKPREILI